MSELLARIRNDFTSAMKERDVFKKTVLGTLIGEVQRLDKGVTDDAIQGVIKKSIDGLNATLVSFDNEESKLELLILQSYMPKKLPNEDLCGIISSMKNKGATLNIVMSYLKDNYKNMYDGAIAASIYKEL